jgi:hypothetical protein
MKEYCIMFSGNAVNGRQIHTAIEQMLESEVEHD